MQPVYYMNIYYYIFIVHKILPQSSDVLYKTVVVYIVSQDP